MRTEFLKAASDWVRLKQAEIHKGSIANANCELIADEILALQKERFQARNAMNELRDDVCVGLSKEDQTIVREFVFCINKQASETKLAELYRKMVVLLSIEPTKRKRRQQPEHEITKWVLKNRSKYASDSECIRRFIILKGRGDFDHLKQELTNDKRRNPLLRRKKTS